MAIDAVEDTFEHGGPSAEEIDRALENGTAWILTCTDRHQDYASQMGCMERKHASKEFMFKAGLRIVSVADIFMG